MIRGFIAGAFDVIHPGYINMFEEAKKHCDHLTIGLHENPEANGKLKPILSTQDRVYILSNLQQVDDVLLYENESGLIDLLTSCRFDLRFLGADYVGRPITGDELAPVHYLDRSHGWSTTKFKTLIYEQIKHEKDRLASQRV